MLLRLYSLDLLEHLENALGGVLEKTLEVLAKAAALKGVATYAFAFSHRDSPDEFLGKADYSISNQLVKGKTRSI